MQSKDHFQLAKPLYTQPSKKAFNSFIYMKIKVHWPACESCDVAHTLINTSINKNLGLTGQCLIHNLTTELFTCNEQLMVDMTHGTLQITQLSLLAARAMKLLSGLAAKMLIKNILPWKFVICQTFGGDGPILEHPSKTLTARLSSSWALLPVNPVMSFWKTQVEVKKVVYLWLEFLSHKHTWTKIPFKPHRYLL